MITPTKQRELRFRASKYQAMARHHYIEADRLRYNAEWENIFLFHQKSQAEYHRQSYGILRRLIDNKD